MVLAEGDPSEMGKDEAQETCFHAEIPKGDEDVIEDQGVLLQESLYEY